MYGGKTWINNEGGYEVIQAIQEYNEKNVERPIVWSIKKIKDAHHMFVITHAKAVIKNINSIVSSGAKSE